MLIIPDTNVLYSDPFLEKPLIMTILAAEGQTGIRLMIPEIIVDELRNKVRQRLNEAVKAADDARRLYDGLRGLESHSVNLMISADQRQAVLDRFERRIRQLEKEDRILVYPSTSVKELVQRSIKGQPPFLSKDRGMRDTLIWLTAKDCVLKGIDRGTKVTLVSDDGAYWEKDKVKIKDGLTAELKESGIPTDSIVVQPSLQEVVRTLVAGRLSTAAWVTVAIQGGRISDFADPSEAVLLKVTDWIYENPETLNFSGSYYSVEFDVVEAVFFQRIEHALDLGDGRALVESRWQCEVAAQGYNNPIFTDDLCITLEFELSSIVKIDGDSLSMQSHEVTGVEAIDTIETQPE